MTTLEALVIIFSMYGVARLVLDLVDTFWPVR